MAMSTAATKSAHHTGLEVRAYHPSDQRDVDRLYVHGLLAGQLSPNDTGADVENIAQAYFADESSHFWVAQVSGAVHGMIGVARDVDHPHTAEIRRLRVDPEHQQSPIAARLIETAVAHCKHHGFLKIVLDTRYDPSTALDLFERFGFQHTRTRNMHGKDTLEFYLDLYHKPKVEPSPHGH